LRCLVEAIKRIDLESKQLPKRELVMKDSSDILTFGSLMQALIEERRRKPTTTRMCT
jgi:hypothetical protein